jgi:hypothetical protein
MRFEEPTFRASNATQNLRRVTSAPISAVFSAAERLSSRIDGQRRHNPLSAPERRLGGELSTDECLPPANCHTPAHPGYAKRMQYIPQTEMEDGWPLLVSIVDGDRCNQI